MALCANKLDLGRRAVSRSEGEDFALTHGMRYFETSAATGEQVTEARPSVVEGLGWCGWRQQRSARHVFFLGFLYFEGQASVGFGGKGVANARFSELGCWMAKEGNNGRGLGASCHVILAGHELPL